MKRDWRLDAVLLVLLCLAAGAQAWLSLRGKSMTFDELTYIPAGYSYVTTGDYRLNPEHPPLTKLLAGLALLPLGPDLDAEHWSWTEANQWAFGRHFFEDTNSDAERMVRIARIPTVLLLMMLVAGAYFLGRELYGPTAGLLAAGLCAFSPNLLAHGRLATNDLALSCFVLLTALTFLRLLRRPTFGSLTVAGVTLGLALLSKFNAVLLLALIPVWAVGVALGSDRMDVPTLSPFERITGERHRRVVFALAAGGVVTLLAGLLTTLGYLAPGRLDIYFRSLQTLYTNVHLTMPTYFNGAFHADGLVYYFVAVFLLKTPLAGLALLALRAADQLKRHEWDWTTGLFLLLPVAAWFVVITATALQYGVRYILPVYPLLFVYAAGIVTSPAFAARRLKGAVAILFTCFVGASLSVHPHYIPFFNLLAGGPEGGIEWLDDSNVDWGQDLPLLKAYIDEHDITDVILGPMTWYAPSIYGVNGEVLGPSQVVRRLAIPNPTPGTYAVSAHLLTRARFDASTPVDPLTDWNPIAVLGHSIYIFRFPENQP